MKGREGTTASNEDSESAFVQAAHAAQEESHTSVDVEDSAANGSLTRGVDADARTSGAAAEAPLHRVSIESLPLDA